MVPIDAPSPIDFRDINDAIEWERKAMDRPFRLDFFDAFAKELGTIKKTELNILELGSGPGFLANHLLSQLEHINIVLLDYSAAMHKLARRRLDDFLNTVSFIERDFKKDNWNGSLGSFDAIITNQAVHELRHKDHAAEFHRQVKQLLNNGGVYLVSDHFCGEGGMQSNQLYMTLEEHRQSLESAGYEVTEVLVKGGRVLNRAIVN